VRLAGVAGAAAAQERHRPRVQPPAALGAAVGVGVPADANLVVRLVDEAQRLLAGARVAVQLERRGAGEEQALGCGVHQCREVGERVGRPEGAVGAVGGEHVMTASMSSLVMPTAYRASTCSMSMISAMRDGSMVRSPRTRRRRAPTPRRHGLAGQHPAVGDLVVGQSVVDVHLGGPLDELGHAGRAAARLARERRRHPHLAGGLQDGRARVVVDGVGATVELDRDPRGGRPRLGRGGPLGTVGGGGRPGRRRRGEPLDVDVGGVHAVRRQRALDEVHERRRAADVELGAGRGLDEGAERIGVDEAALDVEVVDHLEAAAVPLDEDVELGPEDDGVAVAVGVQEADPARGRGQRGLEQREHRGDPAARAEGHDVTVPRPEAEHPRRPGGLDDVARCERLVHPVRHDPAGHALHRHLQLGVDGG
jgi:hypothetical protein